MIKIHKPVQSGVAIETRWKFHCQVVATHILTWAYTDLLKNLSKLGKFSFYLMVDYLHIIEIF